MVANLVKDRWRSLGPRPAEAPLEHDVPMAAHDGLLDRDALMRAARELPPGQRAVLVLRYFDDLSVEETARRSASRPAPSSHRPRARSPACGPRSPPTPTSKENADAHR